MLVTLTVAELEGLVRKCVRDELGAREDDQFLTLVEAAKLMKLSTKTVLKRIKEGLPAERLGHEWRFQKSKVQAFMKGDR